MPSFLQLEEGRKGGKVIRALSEQLIENYGRKVWNIIDSCRKDPVPPPRQRPPPSAALVPGDVGEAKELNSLALPAEGLRP